MVKKPPRGWRPSKVLQGHDFLSAARCTDKFHPLCPLKASQILCIYFLQGLLPKRVTWARGWQGNISSSHPAFIPAQRWHVTSLLLPGVMQCGGPGLSCSARRMLRVGNPAVPLGTTWTAWGCPCLARENLLLRTDLKGINMHIQIDIKCQPAYLCLYLTTRVICKARQSILFESDSFLEYEKEKKCVHKRGLRSLTWESNSVRIISICPQHETGFLTDGNIASRC